MHGRTHLSRRSAGLALALLLGACAIAGRSNPFEQAQQGPQKITLHVRNLNFSDATLWVVARSGRKRLGTVGGKQDAVYTLTWEISEPLQIEIDMLAGPRCLTPQLYVDPGDILELAIETDARQMYDCRGAAQP